LQLLQLFLLLGSQRGDLGTVAEQLVTVDSRLKSGIPFPPRNVVNRKPK
jgi:hypothetical protein